MLDVSDVVTAYGKIEALKGVSDQTDLARAQAELAEAEARYRAAQKLKGK